MNLQESNNITFHNWMVERVSKVKNISLEESRNLISKMSFIEYHKLHEAGITVTPPSGNTIGPTTAPTAGKAPAPTGPQQAPSNVKSIWPGSGAPVEVGMTVGVKGPNGVSAPGQVSQVDMAARGVKVKNPTTGQEEWTNLDVLQPFMANGQNNGQSTGPQAQTQPTTEDATDLQRLRELAGIKENCSAGATGAGSIAAAPATMGRVKRRQPTDEQLKKEYTPKEAAKTIIGDTKPAQASGQLSSTLAANGRKTASRTNNGFKR